MILEIVILCVSRLRAIDLRRFHLRIWPGKMLEIVILWVDHLRTFAFASALWSVKPSKMYCRSDELFVVLSRLGFFSAYFSEDIHRSIVVQ